MVSRWRPEEKGRAADTFRIYALGVHVKKSDDRPNVVESAKPLTADEIAELADRGEEISGFFTNAGRMMPPIAPDAKEQGCGQEN
jgi:hypothetical protein